MLGLHKKRVAGSRQAVPALTGHVVNQTLHVRNVFQLGMPKLIPECTVIVQSHVDNRDVSQGIGNEFTNVLNLGAKPQAVLTV